MGGGVLMASEGVIGRDAAAKGVDVLRTIRTENASSGSAVASTLTVVEIGSTAGVKAGIGVAAGSVAMLSVGVTEASVTGMAVLVTASKAAAVRWAVWPTADSIGGVVALFVATA